MPGIVTLAEIVYTELDDNTNFAGTAYDGDPILYAQCEMGPSQPLIIGNSPNCLRKMVAVHYLRVRYGAGNPHYKNLYKAVLESKLKLNSNIIAQFGTRIIEVDNIDDPVIESVTVQKPYLGIHDGALQGPRLFAGQRQEVITVELYVYTQQFQKSVTSRLIGD